MEDTGMRNIDLEPPNNIPQICFCNVFCRSGSLDNKINPHPFLELNVMIQIKFSY